MIGLYSIASDVLICVIVIAIGIAISKGYDWLRRRR